MSAPLVPCFVFVLGFFFAHLTKRQVLKHTVKFREEAKGGKNRIFEGKETKQEQAEEIAQQDSTRPDSWSVWHHAVLWVAG